MTVKINRVEYNIVGEHDFKTNKCYELRRLKDFKKAELSINHETNIKVLRFVGEKGFLLKPIYPKKIEFIRE